MADFRVNCGFFNHPKTKKLKRTLGPDGVISLLRVWAYAAQNRHGSDKLYSAEEIELAVDWEGEVGKFAEILARHGWLDETKDRYMLHEWGGHNGYAATAQARSEAGRKAAAARWESRRGTGPDPAIYATECDGICGSYESALPMHANGNAPSPIPYPIPSPKKEENTYVVPDAPQKKAPKSKTRHEYTPEYEAFFAAYPARHGQKNGKHPGQKAFERAVRTGGVTPEFLVERIKALSLQYGEYPPDIATWLNNRRWEDPMANPTGSPSTGIDVEAVEAELARRKMQ